MQILSWHRTFVHTHFVTDCVRLPSHRMREIQGQMHPCLRRLGIVFGIRFESQPGEEGVRIVLECIPLRDVLEFIQVELQRIIERIPARPRRTQVVHLDRPASAVDKESERGVTRSEASP